MDKDNWSNVGKAAFVGAVGGAAGSYVGCALGTCFTAATLGNTVGIGMISGATGAYASELTNQALNNTVDYNRLSQSIWKGALCGAALSAATYGILNYNKGSNVACSETGNVNGATPASRAADVLQAEGATKNGVNTVSVLRTKAGNEFTGVNSEGITNEYLNSVLQEVGVNQFGGACAEMNAIAKALNSGVNLDGTTISTSYVRGPYSTSGLHGTNHIACDTCAKVIEELEITINLGG